MGKFRPEMIKVCMQLGYPDESGDNKCDGEPVLHFIMLCSEDEDKDALVIYEDDVQNFKDEACCYYNTLFRGKQPEIESKLTSVVTEWLTDRTQLHSDDILYIANEVKDRVSDLKGRVESILYINKLGSSYLKHNRELYKEIVKVLNSNHNTTSNDIGSESLEKSLVKVLKDNGVDDLYPIIISQTGSLEIDFKIKRESVN